MFEVVFKVTEIIFFCFILMFKTADLQNNCVNEQ